MAGREPKTLLVVGAKKHGKSTYVADLVAESQWKNAIIYKRGVDVTDKAFKAFPPVSIKKYTGGKVIIDGSEIEYTKLLKLVNAKFRNGLFVVDDAIKFERNTLTQECIDLVAVNRRMFLDVIYIYHSMRQVPLDLFDYVTDIVMFHTTGNFKYKADKLPDIGDELLEAQKEIKAIVKQCRCGDPCKCGKRYTMRYFKMS